MSNTIYVECSKTNFKHITNVIYQGRHIIDNHIVASIHQQMKHT